MITKFPLTPSSGTAIAFPVTTAGIVLGVAGSEPRLRGLGSAIFCLYGFVFLRAEAVGLPFRWHRTMPTWLDDQEEARLNLP